jgi:hypothetical protein
LTLKLPSVFYGGIDCGLSGAVVGLTPVSALYDLFRGLNQVGLHQPSRVVLRTKAPTYRKKKQGTRYNRAAMLEILRSVKEEYDYVFFCIEKSHSRVTDSRPAAWTTGCGFGFWLMALEAVNIPFRIIPPRTWQDKFFPPREERQGTTKEISVQTAKVLLPDLNLIPTARSRKEDHNISDAGLLALYCSSLSWS